MVLPGGCMVRSDPKRVSIKILEIVFKSIACCNTSYILFHIKRLIMPVLKPGPPSEGSKSSENKTYILELKPGETVIIKNAE